MSVRVAAVVTPATGATGKPLSFLFTDPRAHMTLPADDCPHTTKTFKAGAWACKRCGEPR